MKLVIHNYMFKEWGNVTVDIEICYCMKGKVTRRDVKVLWTAATRCNVKTDTRIREQLFNKCYCVVVCTLRPELLG
jgi:hypothetical protein